MQILLDECVPSKLKQYLVGHEVFTVRQMGWTGKKNGELLKLMQASKIEVLLTVNKNLPFQQNIGVLSIALIVLKAKTIKSADLIGLVPDVLAVLPRIRPGDVVEVGTETSD